MFKEIGGYIELDTYRGDMLYDDAIKLNCGRRALEYIIRAKNIQRMLVPKFMCDSNYEIYRKYNVECRFYQIDKNFKPIIPKPIEGEWIYVVNYCGQLTNDYLKSLGGNIIVDNSQAYYQEPINGIDSFYNCRKFFGVADGAILFTDKTIDDIPQDESFERMHFLLGRYERNASEFYQEYVDNNELFDNVELKTMSKLTENLLHAVDYNYIKDRRNANYIYLHDTFGQINELELLIPNGPYMYPLYVKNGDIVRKKLQQEKIYIPTLWPNVLNECDEADLEYDYAKNILPLPVDQRYGIEDMRYLVDAVKRCIG